MGSNILFHEKISDASFCDAYDTRTHMIVVSLSLRFLSFFFRSLKFGSQQIKMIDAYIFHESNYVLMNAVFVYFHWVKCKGTYASGKSLLIFATEKTKLFHLQILLEFNHWIQLNARKPTAAAGTILWSARKQIHKTDRMNGCDMLFSFSQKKFMKRNSDENENK